MSYLLSVPTTEQGLFLKKIIIRITNKSYLTATFTSGPETSISFILFFVCSLLSKVVLLVSGSTHRRAVNW